MCDGLAEALALVAASVVAPLAVLPGDADGVDICANAMVIALGRIKGVNKTGCMANRV